MKKRKICLLALASVLTFGTGITLAACQNDNSGQKTIEATSVRLTLSESEVNEGDKVTVQVEITPSDASDKTYTLTSSNEAVAKINDDNTISALKEGEAIITATLKNGIKGEAKLKVKKLIIDVSDVNLKVNREVFEVGEEVGYSVEVFPQNATNKNYTISVEDNGVLEIDSNNKITAKKAGTGKITVKTEDKEKTNEVTVKVEEARETYKFEAENAELVGEKIAAVTEQNSKASNGAHVGLFEVPGDYLNFKVNSVIAQKVQLEVNIAWLSADNFSTLFDTYVNNKIVTFDNDKSPVKLDSSNWFNWGLLRLGEIDLLEGLNEVKFVYKKSQTNFDYINLRGYSEITNYVDPESVDVEGETYEFSAEIAKTSSGKLGALSAVKKDGEFSHYGNFNMNEGAKVTYKLEVAEATKVTLYVSLGMGVSASNDGFNVEVNGENAKTGVRLVDNENGWEIFHYQRAGNIELKEGINEISIVATAHNSGNLRGIKLISPILVKEAPVSVESVQVSADKTTLNVGETANVNVNILPENATNKEYVLSSSNPEVASVDESGLVTALKEGTTEIIATSVDGGKVGKVTITVLTDVKSFVFEGDEAELDGATIINEAGKGATGDRYVGAWSEGKSLTYFIASNEDGVADLTVNLSWTGSNKISDIFDIYVNKAEFTPTNVTAPVDADSGNRFNWSTLNIGSINLNKGNNSIKFVAKGVATNFDYIRLDTKLDLEKGEDPDQVDIEGEVYEISGELAEYEGCYPVQKDGDFAYYGGFNASEAKVTFFVNSDETVKAALYLTMGLGGSNCPGAINVYVNDELRYEKVNFKDQENGWEKFHDLKIGNIELLEGENKIVIESIKDKTSGNLKGIKLKSPSHVEGFIKTYSVESISLSLTNDEILVGATTQANVSFNPTNATNKNVTFSSLNEDVATVSSTGLVTGVNEGETTITAISEDGGKVSSATIKVVNAMKTLKIEGEDGYMEGCGVTDESSAGSNASNGKHAGGWNQEKAISYFVNASESGKASLDLIMAPANSSRLLSFYCSIYVNDEELTLPSSEFAAENQGWWAWTRVNAGQINLKEGNNSIRLVAKTNEFNLDYIELHSTLDLSNGENYYTSEVEGTEKEILGNDSRVVITEGQYGMPGVQYNGDNFYQIGNWNANEGATLTFTVNASEAGLVTLYAKCGVPVSDYNNVVRVYVNDEMINYDVKATIPSDNQGWDNWYAIKIASVYLKEGNNTVKFKMISGGTSGNFYSLVLKSNFDIA